MTQRKPQSRLQGTASTPANQTGSLKTGYWVALTLKPDTAPLRCYVGRVCEVDGHGVRLTLVDWLTGMATNHDFFATWESITSALVATPDDDIEMFGDAARKWQGDMCGYEVKETDPQ